MSNGSSEQTDERLQRVIADYDAGIQELQTISKPGRIRTLKGRLVERITEQLVRVAWSSIDGQAKRLGFEHRRYNIPIVDDYIERIPYDVVRQHARANIDDYNYELGCDVQCYVDGEFALAVECKAYVEVAMLKRVMVDASMLKFLFSDLRFALLQLENFMGGDYGKLEQPVMGSSSAHTVMSYFDVDMHIITLLSGDRDICRPIHKKEYCKPLTLEALRNATRQLSGLLARLV